MPNLQTQYSNGATCRVRTGRLALRESAIAIEVALDIDLRNQTAISEKAAEVAPEVVDVWKRQREPSRHATPP